MRQEVAAPRGMLERKGNHPLHRFGRRGGGMAFVDRRQVFETLQPVCLETAFVRVERTEELSLFAFCSGKV